MISRDRACEFQYELGKLRESEEYILEGDFGVVRYEVQNFMQLFESLGVECNCSRGVEVLTEAGTVLCQARRAG